jgi:hypothetical protein
MGYFEGAVTSMTPKDILGFDNIQHASVFIRVYLNRRRLDHKR